MRMLLGPFRLAPLGLCVLIGRSGEAGVNLNPGERTVAEAFGGRGGSGCQNVFSQGAPEKIQ